MDYSDFFSADTHSFVPSPARELFKKVDLTRIYSLANGQPDPATFPLDEFSGAMDAAVRKYGAKAFLYGGTQGVPELREAVAQRCSMPVGRVQITTSSQQGIDVCSRVFLDPGDVVITSNPTYLGAIQSFKSYRAEIVGVSHEADLVEFEKAYDSAVSEVLARGKKVKFLYMISDFQNPSGESLTEAERRVLISLAEKYNFLIVEDAPYRELRYDGEEVPAMYSMAPDRVLYLGSFSKIMCPGLRLGWIIANPDLLHQIYVCKQSLDLCPPVFNQYVVAEHLSSGHLDARLKETVAVYRRKRDLVLAALEKYMPEGISWTRPSGGMFIFMTLPDGFDTTAFSDTALSKGVAYIPGKMFFTDSRGANTMRLNFSFMEESKLEKGVEILAGAIRDEMVKLL